MKILVLVPNNKVGFLPRNVTSLSLSIDCLTSTPEPVIEVNGVQTICSPNEQSGPERQMN